MRFLNVLLVGLLRLPLRTRLIIVICCFSFFFIFFVFSPFNGPLLALPLALAVWLFPRRGAFASTALTVLALAITSSIKSHSLLWSALSLQGFLTGSFALITEASFICYVRYLSDQAEAARVQTLQAEKQRSVAYELQVQAQQLQQRMTYAYEQQCQLNELKDRFILNVSHELRTPVQTVLGYLELLLDFDEKIDTSMRAKSLAYAFHACKELQLLVNNVLDTVQISHGEQTPVEVEVPVRQVVQDALTLLEPQQVRDSALSLDIPADLMVVADFQLMRQVILNLLTNALKYCPAPRAVTISATLHDAEGLASASSPQVCISVKDTGPGIPPEEKEFLFERFVRLKRDLSGPVHGTGLGLSICKDLVEAMGGRIWVESSGIPGQGSCFRFTLPYAARATYV